ncbi:hypothetical protein ACKI1J_18115 [Streptomyces scabiei]|uniref:hypothetical protein n=1 Tax=Streptomyces scabiei TaxID=1930 RepID=UPI0038F7241B
MNTARPPVVITMGWTARALDCRRLPAAPGRARRPAAPGVSRGALGHRAPPGTADPVRRLPTEWPAAPGRPTGWHELPPYMGPLA